MLRSLYLTVMIISSLSLLACTKREPAALVKVEANDKTEIAPEIFSQFRELGGSWVESILPFSDQPVMIFIVPSSSTEKCLQLLSTVKNVYGLEILSQDFSKIDSSKLVANSSIRYLSLFGCKLDSSHLLNFSENIQHLSLSNCIFYDKDNCLKHISRFAKLQSLNISLLQLSNADYLEIAKLKNIMHLSLSTNLTNSGLEQINNISTLQSLKIIGTDDVTDVGISKLNTLRNLKSIEFDFLANLTIESLRSLGKNCPIQSLKIGANTLKITDSALDIIRSMKDLNELSICMKDLSYDGKLAIFKMQKLNKLELQGNIGDFAIRDIQHLKNLTHLKLSCNIYNTALDAISKLENLQVIDLSGCKTITDKGLEKLSALTNLHSIDLSRTLVSDDCLSRLNNKKRITELYLLVTEVNGDFLDGFDNLNTLNLTGSRVSDVNIDKICLCKKLKTLYLLNTSISDAGEKKIRAQLPNVNIQRYITN